MLLLNPNQQAAEAIGPLEQVARYPNALHARPSHVLMDVFIEHRISPLPGPA